MTLHALLVDDNLQNLEVLAQLLENLKVSSTPITDPREALATISTLPQLDVIFLDLEMSKLDGYRLLKDLRDKIGHRVPIICSTVHLPEMDNARRVGFDGFIGKPLDSERFPDQMVRILNRQPVWELP